MESPDPQLRPNPAGVRIGPYRLLREIGSGGMGTVYLARRDDGQYSKSVALKMSHAGGFDLRDRFWKERQILACLNHPNIAALLDGGESEDGRLYEVMEYVDGIPLNTYCANHQLSVEKRLRLFLLACAAVQHAHRHLIVHRDLKPGNILVTPEGSVKLIDFGIAKVLRPELFPMFSLDTLPGDAMMTMIYASPEQIRGEPVSTATDVYALGVVLFELITGQFPYSGQLSGLALRESICTKPPRRLSDAMNLDAAARTRLAGGDLDTIAAMALRKEPDRRYSSVEQMAADIDRHLSGFPVSARKDTMRYRASKFVGRHRSMVAAAAAAVIVLAASSVVNYRIARQAEYERDTARVVADFMAGIFHAPNPSSASGGSSLTARELLERGESRIDEELKDKPEVRARLLTIMGQTQKDLGNLDRGLALFERALEVRLTLHGENHPDVAETLHGMARVLNVKGRYDESEKALRRALLIQQAALPRSSRDTLRTMSTLGLVLNQRGQVEQSAAVLEAALVELRKTGDDAHGSDDDLYEDTLNSYSLALQELGRFDECEQARRTLLELDRRRYGEAHINYAMDLATVGSMLRERDALDQAEPMLRRSLELHRKILPAGSTGVIHTMQYLALCLQKMGRLDEAEALWNELRPLRVKLVGEKHRFVASDLAGWADLLRRRGDLNAAEAAMRKAIEIRKAVLKENHPIHANSRISLGHILADRGSLTAAESEFRGAYDLLRRLHGEDNPRSTAAAELELGRALAHVAGRGEEAGRLLRHSYEARRQALPPDDWQLSDSMLEYGRFLTAAGRPAEGEPLVGKANAIRERSTQQQHQSASRKLAAL